MLLPFFVVVMVESQPLINEIEDRIDRVFHIEEHGKYFEEAGKSLGKALDKVEDQAEETLKNELDTLKEQSQTVNEDLLSPLASSSLFIDSLKISNHWKNFTTDYFYLDLE